MSNQFKNGDRVRYTGPDNRAFCNHGDFGTVVDIPHGGNITTWVRLDHNDELQALEPWNLQPITGPIRMARKLEVIREGRRRLFREYKRYLNRYRKLLMDLHNERDRYEQTIQEYKHALAREKEKRIELSDSWAKTCEELEQEKNGEAQDRQEKEQYMHWYADKLQEEARKHTTTKERLKELEQIEEAHRRENGELHAELGKLRTEHKTPADRVMPHGKWRGYTIGDVLDQEPNYLGWMLMNGQNVTIPWMTARERSLALEAYFRSLRTC